MLTFRLLPSNAKARAAELIAMAKTGNEVGVSDWEVIAHIVEMLQWAENAGLASRFVRQDAARSVIIPLDTMVTAVQEGIEIRPLS